MKKASIFFTGMFIILVSLTVQAQDKTTDYFAGDWNVVIEGTPSGDAEMIMHLERVDGKLQGEMKSEGVTDVIKIERIEEKETSIEVFYFASGYDISMNFEKSDENNIKGSLLGMFTANGVRVVK